MPDSKIYLNVPYQEKDSAKALGARWDPVNKKWYAPANKDITLFAKWQPETVTSKASSTATNKPRSRAPSSINSLSANNKAVGVITYPKNKDFVAYKGDEPPWE